MWQLPPTPPNPHLPRNLGSASLGMGGRGPACFFPHREGRGFMPCPPEQTAAGQVTSNLTKVGQIEHPWPVKVSQTQGWTQSCCLAASLLSDLSQGGESRACDCQDSRLHREAEPGRRELSSLQFPRLPASSPSSPLANLKATSRNPNVAASRGRQESLWRRGWGPWC